MDTGGRLRYAGYAGNAEIKGLIALTGELPRAVKFGAALIAGPFLGLTFVVVLPFAGLALAAWMATKAVAHRLAGAAHIVRRVALFAVAPFVGLAYLIALPFVGIGAMGYFGIRAARK